MGNSLIVGGAKMGMDVRHLRAEGPLAARRTSSSSARRSPRRPGAKITITDDPAVGVKGVDYLYTDVWVSMGEDKSVWDERMKLLKPYQVNAAPRQEDRQPAA